MVRELDDISKLEVWRTIRRGDHTSAEASRKALKAADCHISNVGDNILGKADFGPTETDELDLVVVSSAELGCPEGATRQWIYGCALALGLEKVPHWGGPALREEYKDQPLDEQLFIGMEPIITGSPGSLYGVFALERFEGDLWILVYLNDFWLGCFRWVFVRPKSK